MPHSTNQKWNWDFKSRENGQKRINLTFRIAFILEAEALQVFTKSCFPLGPTDEHISQLSPDVAMRLSSAQWNREGSNVCHLQIWCIKNLPLQFITLALFPHSNWKYRRKSSEKWQSQTKRPRSLTQRADPCTCRSWTETHTKKTLIVLSH